MGKIYLVIGGRRSGKSDFALKYGETLIGPRAFLATCPSIDEEMDQRIKRHQQERDDQIWTTIEEQINLAQVMERDDQFNLFLIDCVTLWINNQIFQATEQNLIFSEAELIKCTEHLLDVCDQIKADVIFVSNEIGLGVVPNDPETRFFLDLLGRCNQILAGRSYEVFLVSCGIPVKIKKGSI
ncbi:MAG: bifunctional adenosylcobinamide kinase/adenosylcobinamide-phosphate guanylyltransferase [Syntrophaceae bacterium]|nr:bifunctional adenosylcobinamide kinase/adenosylcobinamide-phosphate guanylyltransferase [Syntrophaceae bacterium]